MYARLCKSKGGCRPNREPRAYGIKAPIQPPGKFLCATFEGIAAPWPQLNMSSSFSEICFILGIQGRSLVTYFAGPTLFLCENLEKQSPTMQPAMRPGEIELFKSVMRCATKYVEFGSGGSTVLAHSMGARRL